MLIKICISVSLYCGLVIGLIFSTVVLGLDITGLKSNKDCENTKLGINPIPNNKYIEIFLNILIKNKDDLKYSKKEKKSIQIKTC